MDWKVERGAVEWQAVDIVLVENIGSGARGGAPGQTLRRHEPVDNR